MAYVSEPEEIDRLAEERRWFHPEWDGNSYKMIQAYLSKELDLSAVVPWIADPIDERYSTADGGRAIRDAEQAAENERQFHDAVKAEEILDNEEYDTSPIEPIVDADNEEYDTTEGLLWDLWYGVLHAAKRIPWRDEEAQLRLVALVRALKDRPDPPPPPKQMTRALQNNWVWGRETFWSSLVLLGPSARETRNDCPGCGAGYELPEIHAWTNVNAFVARLTHLEIFDFLTYCGWCLRDALETEPTDNDPSCHHPAAATTQLNARVPAAAVWIMVLGKKLHDLAADETSEDFGGGGPLWEARTTDKRGLSRERWGFWKERLGMLRDRETLAQETRDVAAEAIRKMEEVEDYTDDGK